MGPETHLGLGVVDMTASKGARASPAELVAELRFRRNVEQVHSLGARAVGELLAELGSERGIQTIIDQKVRRFAAIDPQHLTALDGDRFMAPPLALVPPTNNEPAT